MKYYTIYRIANLVNGSIYVGQHITNNLDDGYMGSSTVLKNAINKHGIKNFKKDILHVFDNFEDMDKKEKEIVNSEFLKRKDVYNINEGGTGGFYHLNHGKSKSVGDKARKKGRKVLANKIKNDPEYRALNIKRLSSGRDRYIKVHGGTFTGKKHTDEFKKNIGKVTSKAQKGSGNSQYGKCWVHNLELKQNKSIKKEELDYYLSHFWIKGRKMKF